MVIPGLLLVGLLSATPLRAQAPKAAGPGIFAANCAGCHGADGRGGEHAPNIATAPEVQHLADRDLAGILKNGIAGAGMPAFSFFSQEQSAQVISYLRVLQGRGDIVKLTGDPKVGEALYFGKGECSSCHMVNGRGGFIGTNLSYYGAETAPEKIRGIILNPEANLPAEKKATTVVTNRGQTFTGMLKVNDNFSLSLQTLDGVFHFLKKSELSSIDAGSHSLMPASTLNGKEVDDLVSYLIQTGADSTRNSGPHAASEEDDN